MAGLLIILAIVGAWQQGFERVYAQLFLAVSAACGLDLILHYLKTKKLIFPSSAFISGMIIALVLAPQSSWLIVLLASFVAVASKHIICFRDRHIFNPANLGLLCSILIFSAYATWWGLSFWPLILIVGIFICHRIRRLEIPIIFAGCFLILFGPKNFALINLFFMFIMLIEPKTTPVTRKGQRAYAAIAALFSLAFFKLAPQFDSSVLALTSANALVPFLNRLKG